MKNYVLLLVCNNFIFIAVQEERGPRNNKKSKQNSEVLASRGTVERTGTCRDQTLKPLMVKETPVSAFRPVFPGSRHATLSSIPIHTRYMLGKLIV